MQTTWPEAVIILVDAKVYIYIYIYLYILTKRKRIQKHILRTTVPAVSNPKTVQIKLIKNKVLRVNRTE